MVCQTLVVALPRLLPAAFAAQLRPRLQQPVDFLMGTDSGHVGMVRGDAKRLQLTQTLVPPKRRAVVGVRAHAAAEQQQHRYAGG